MSAQLVRKLMPEGSIIGVSVNTPEEATHAVKDGADYIGIGSVWSTSTKKNVKTVIGVRGVGEVIDALGESQVKSVAIGSSSVHFLHYDVHLLENVGGIKERNLLRTMHGAVSVSGRGLDGVAVVSAIMGSTEPAEAARALSHTMKAFNTSYSLLSEPSSIKFSTESIMQRAAHLLTLLRKYGPVVHQASLNFCLEISAFELSDLIYTLLSDHQQCCDEPIR